MKKVILGAAALMISAIGFSQVPGAPVATPVAPISGAAVGANTGLSVQNGNDNKVRVRQAGTSQSVYTNQDDGTGIGGNLARVTQTGVVNPLSGELNNAEVLQSGSENQSTTYQQGDLNNASTRQGQNDLSSSGNKAKIQQGNANNAEANFAAIEQDGDDNSALTFQTYDNSDAWTVQDGDRNKSYIRQNAGPNNTEGHLAQVEQVGDDNQSIINQSGAGARNTARTFQEGDGNYANQQQTTDALSGSGNGNTAIVAQGNVFTGFGFDPIYFDLLLVDNLENGAMTTESLGGIAFQTQSGSENSADIRQFGSEEGNYGEQNQSGSGNNAFIVQNLYGNPSGGANYARQDQSGTNSQAGIGQNGFNHKAYQRQLGDDNIALSTQRGQGNVVNTYQDGDSNRAETAQRGECNQILLVQRGGHSYSVDQNLADGMSNGHNSADILQLGPNGNFGTDGINCIIPDQMDPTAPIMPDPFTLTDPCPGC